jgi:PAS domain S-box-containing protein
MCIEQPKSKFPFFESKGDIAKYLVETLKKAFSTHLAEPLDELDTIIAGINMLGEELKVSQEKYVALFEYARDAILIFSTTSNKFVDSNNAATMLLGFSAEDIRLLSILDLFPKEEKTRIESKFADLKAVVTINFDTQIETKAGKLVDVIFLVKILPYGNDQYFHISLRDITESKKISTSLVKKNTELNKAQKEIALLSKFPSENPNPILRFNEKFELLYKNEASTINFNSDFKITENKSNDRILKGYINRSKLKGISETIIETRNKRHYSLTLVHVQEFDYTNIYAADITDFINQVNEKKKNLIYLKDTIESQKNFYERILNSLPYDIAVFDKKHRYLFVNPIGVKDDVTRKFLIGKDDFDYVNFKGISDEKAVERRKFFNRIIGTKRPETWLDEFTLKNGSRKIVERSLFPILDDKGDLHFVIGYGTDITTRVIAQDENKTLSLFAKNTNNGVLMLNKNREIIWANPAFLERSGYSLSEITGQTSTNYLLNNRNGSSIDKVNNSINKREKVSAELMRKSKKGKEYWVDLNVQPLYDKTNNISGFMFVEFDITDRITSERTINNLNINLENIVKQKTKNLRDNKLKLEKSLSKEKERRIELVRSEKKLKKSLIKEKELGKLKESFITVASHQFRTPLAVIQSNTDLLEMINNTEIQQPPEKYSKVTERITSAVSKMTELMEDVLTLGKLTSGSVPCTPKALDLVDLCKKIAQEFNFQMDGRCLDLSIKGEPYNMQLDPNLLNHALSNLISNAFKYSLGKDNPELSIHFKPKELLLSIKDYGLGIPEAQHLHLFEAFFRADNATEIKGTGLGLNIAKEYVEANNGKIAAASILGEGSCFEITFKR